jgi:hypothetical protein
MSDRKPDKMATHVTDDSSWRSAYVILRPGAKVPFRACKLQLATA